MIASIFSLVLSCGVGQAPKGDTQRKPLDYAPAPIDNPLKGLVPYQGDYRKQFPHSLEFNYLPYSALVKGYDEFDWKTLETMLDEIASRGHQTVLRIFLEYPNKKGAIPEFLIKDGLKVTKWNHKEIGDTKSNPVETPDYEDKNLRKSLKSFITAFGKKYDGDPRLGYITTGLLGLWGEWHNYPKSELFASKPVQLEVLDAYEVAFKITPVLLRYPAGEKDFQKAKNSNRKFGYHDDSFAWATLETGKKGDEWFYMTILKAAGADALAKWKTHPIGGEIRPEAWGKVFDEKPDLKQIQDFRQCVEATHATWLMDSGMFEKKQSAERIKRAEEEVRRMGYEFHCPAVSIVEEKENKVMVKLEIENRGVAPFYYDWKVEWAILKDGKVIKAFPVTGKINGLLPGDPVRIWADTLDIKGIAPDSYTLAVRVANPLKTGNPIRFANKTQDTHAKGWLSLGEIIVR